MRADQVALQDRIDPVRVSVLLKEAGRFFALDQPSLLGLSYVLRHRDLWPRGFRWYYGHCSTCAMGLACELWSVFPSTNVSTVSTIVQAFSIPVTAVRSIFLGMGEGNVAAGWIPEEGIHLVTPEMVADQIDKYLATVK